MHYILTLNKRSKFIYRRAGAHEEEWAYNLFKRVNIDNVRKMAGRWPEGKQSRFFRSRFRKVRPHVIQTPSGNFVACTLVCHIALWGECMFSVGRNIIYGLADIFNSGHVKGLRNLLRPGCRFISYFGNPLLHGLIP